MRRQVVSHPEDVWEMHRPRIRRLYIEEDKKLSEVMHQLVQKRLSSLREFFLEIRLPSNGYRYGRSEC